MRAHAALFVVFLHTHMSVKFGIFFVLSGFVMALVIQHRRTPFDFMTGRIARIVPMYWFMSVILHDLPHQYAGDWRVS
jgi:peptidoglycan/LPS O-acetylase OafA/YrhL